MTTEERRCSPRLFHSLDATIRIPHGDELEGKTIDLSATGVALDLGKELPIGQSVSICFQVSLGKSFSAQGKVQRVKPVFEGTRFVTALSFSKRQPELFASACARDFLIESESAAL